MYNEAENTTCTCETWEILIKTLSDFEISDEK